MVKLPSGMMIPEGEARRRLKDSYERAEKKFRPIFEEHGFEWPNDIYKEAQQKGVDPHAILPVILDVTSLNHPLESAGEDDQFVLRLSTSFSVSIPTDNPEFLKEAMPLLSMIRDIISITIPGEVGELVEKYYKEHQQGNETSGVPANGEEACDGAPPVGQESAPPGVDGGIPHPAELQAEESPPSESSTGSHTGGGGQAEIIHFPGAAAPRQDSPPSGVGDPGKS